MCVCVHGMQIAPKQMKGLVLGSLLPPPPPGVVVCEGLTLGAVGCGGGGGFGLGCVVSRARVRGGVVLRGVGQKAWITPPPSATPPPPKEKNQSNLASRLVYGAHSLCTPPPEAPRAPEILPPPKPPNGEAPKVCMPSWGVSLCIMCFSLKLIFESVILTFVGYLPSWVYPAEVLYHLLGVKAEQHVLASSSSKQQQQAAGA